MIEPVIEALTSGYIRGPCRSATKAITTSAALPNVALSNPPTPDPRRAARLSVARPIKPASGTMATPDAKKTQRSSAPEYRAATASGTATSSQSSGWPIRYFQTSASDRRRLMHVALRVVEFLSCRFGDRVRLHTSAAAPSVGEYSGREPWRRTALLEHVGHVGRTSLPNGPEVRIVFATHICILVQYPRPFSGGARRGG